MRVRVLMFLAVVFFVIALICTLVPTKALNEGWQVWTIAGLLVWAIDVALGGYVFDAPARRPPPAA